MTFELALRDRIGDAYNFTVADGTGIEKGTLLSLANPRTAAKSAVEGEVCAGVLAREKVADDDRTQCAVIMDGIFDATASGAIPIGCPIMSAGQDNHVKLVAGISTSGAAIIGYALEEASDKEKIQCRINVGTGGGFAL